MKLILEIDKNDISPIFEGIDLKPRHLGDLHFDGYIRENWYKFNEIWFVSESGKTLIKSKK